MTAGDPQGGVSDRREWAGGAIRGRRAREVNNPPNGIAQGREKDKGSWGILILILISLSMNKKGYHKSI